MFVRKSRHFVEFAFILIFVSVLSYFMAQATALINIKIPHNDLEFNPNADTSVNVLIDDEEN
jgi:hypothetical protein